MRQRFRVQSGLASLVSLLSLSLFFSDRSEAQEGEDFLAIRTLVVQVTGTEGTPLNGLEVEDFEILESGVKRDIVEVKGSKEQQTEIVLLVDTSVAFVGQMHILRRAVDSFVRAVAANNVISIYEFGGTPRLLTGPTEDSGALLKGVKRLHVKRQEGAYVLDAVAETARELGETERKEGNPAHVVILTAMGPELSSHRYEQVKKMGEGSGAVYHVVVCDGPVGSNDMVHRGEVVGALTHLSETTGGTLTWVLAATGIEPKLTNIAAELVPLYRISFLTELSPKSRFEDLSVSVPESGARVELIRLLPEEKKVPVSK